MRLKVTITFWCLIKTIGPHGKERGEFHWPHDAAFNTAGNDQAWKQQSASNGRQLTVRANLGSGKTEWANSYSHC